MRRQIVALAILAVLIGSGTVFGQEGPPLPPIRPKGQAEPPPAPSPVQIPDGDEDIDDTPAPSRDRIERCATQWREMKRKGADVGITWRSFAHTCFKR
jgi:hypothetical protein